MRIGSSTIQDKKQRYFFSADQYSKNRRMRVFESTQEVLYFLDCSYWHNLITNESVAFFHVTKVFAREPGSTYTTTCQVQSLQIRISFLPLDISSGINQLVPICELEKIVQLSHWMQMTYRKKQHIYVNVTDTSSLLYTHITLGKSICINDEVVFRIYSDVLSKYN